MANFARGLQAGLPLGLAFGEAARERRERKAYQEAAQQWTPEETELNLGDAPISGGASPMARGIGPQVSQEQRQQLESQRLAAPPGAQPRSQTQRRFTLPGAPGETYETQAQARRAARIPGMEAQLEAARNVGDAELVGDLTRQLSATEASDATRRLNDLRFEMLQKEDQRYEELRSLSQEMVSLETPEERFEFARNSGQPELMTQLSEYATSASQIMEANRANDAMQAAAITNRALKTYFETGDVGSFYDIISGSSNGAATLVEAEDRNGRSVYSLQIDPQNEDYDPFIVPVQGRTPEEVIRQLAIFYSDPQAWLELENRMASRVADSQTTAQLNKVADDATKKTQSAYVQRIGGVDTAAMDDTMRARWEASNIDEAGLALAAEEVVNRIAAQGEPVKPGYVTNVLINEVRYDPEIGFHIPGKFLGGSDLEVGFVVEGSDLEEELIQQHMKQQEEEAERAAELARRRAGGPGVDTPAQGLRPRDPNAPWVDLPGWWEGFRQGTVPGRERAEPREGQNTGWTGEGGVRESPAGRFVRGLFNQGGEEPSGEQNAPQGGAEVGRNPQSSARGRFSGFMAANAADLPAEQQERRTGGLARGAAAAAQSVGPDIADRLEEGAPGAFTTARQIAAESRRENTARDGGTAEDLSPEDTQTLRERTFESFNSGLFEVESVGSNVEGDVDTGPLGLTRIAIEDIVENGNVEGLTEDIDLAQWANDYLEGDEDAVRMAEEAADVLARTNYNRLVRGAYPDLDLAPAPIREALLDASYNMGVGNVNGFSLLPSAVENKDWLEAARQTLDTAQLQGGQSMWGLAKRRAEGYNQIAAELGEPPIIQVDVLDDGRITYQNDEGVVMDFSPSGGRHPQSEVGTKVFDAEQGVWVEEEQDFSDGGPVRRSGPGVDTPGAPSQRDDAPRRDWRDSAAAGLRASRAAQSAQRGGPSADAPLSYRPLEETSAMDRLRRSQVQAPRNMANGGLARKDMRGGGDVDGPGTETSDSIPARLSDGEYVLNAETVKMVGEDFLDRINKEGLRRRDSRKRR